MFSDLEFKQSGKFLCNIVLTNAMPDTDSWTDEYNRDYHQHKESPVQRKVKKYQQTKEARHQQLTVFTWKSFLIPAKTFLSHL